MSNIFRIMQMAGSVPNVVSAIDISGATYDSKSFSFSSQETDPLGLYFKPDGTKMYMVGRDSDTVYQYSLSTAWDVSTASYDSKSFSVSSKETIPGCLAFSTDGTEMYTGGNDSDQIHQYTLSTAWDVSTASFTQSYNPPITNDNIASLFFKEDGTKMYWGSLNSGLVYEYDLSTAWDISTASPSGNSKSSGGNPAGVWLKPDGTQIFIASTTANLIYQFELSTAWDLSSASGTTTFDPTSQTTFLGDLSFKPDGTKMYILERDSDLVLQYSL